MDHVLVWTFPEILAKLKRQQTLKKRLTRCNAPFSICAVPNQPATDRTQLCVRLPRTLKKRLEKLANKRGLTLTELIETLIQQQVANVELSPDEYREIANDIERANRD
jgi:predicted DNA-binding protein